MIGLLLTGDHFFGDEQVFVDYLTAQLPNSVIVDNVFPYSVLNTGRRALQRFWAWVARKRSWERASVYDVPIIMRNVLQVTIPYSDDVLMSLKTPPGAFETEARLLLAVKLLELGRIATGMAAHLAGVSRVAFVMALDQIVAVVLRRLNRGRIAPC